MQQVNFGANWSDSARLRLPYCMALSSLLLVACLLLVRLKLPLPMPFTETPVLEVSLPPPVAPVDEHEITNEPATEVVGEIIEEAAPVAVPVPATSAGRADSEAVPEVAAPGPPVDWYAELERISAEIAARLAEPPSLHPHFDELRRIAKLHYGPPKNDPVRPIWENVETDQLGRKILRSGDCFRIIDDPSVANRYVFETFQQYMVYCTYQPSKAHWLPWVEVIRARYDYLRSGEERDLVAR